MKQYLDLEIELVMLLQDDVVRTSDGVVGGGNSEDAGDDPYADFN